MFRHPQREIHRAKVQLFFEECKYLLYFLQKNIFIGVFATPYYFVNSLFCY